MDRIAELINKSGGSGLSYEDGLRIIVDRYNKTPGSLTGFDCPVCLNKGHTMVIRGGEELTRVCSCMEIRKSLKRIENSGLGEMLGLYSFGNFKTDEKWQKNIKDAAIKFVSGKNGWFFIGGQVGAGKTHICTAIINELLKSGKAAKYMLWRDEIVPLKGMVCESADYVKNIGKLKSIDVLYIDDFFKTEKGKCPSAADINIAFEILNYRYLNSGMITVLSSEKSISEILDIDEGVGSRIFQRAGGFCFDLGQDRKRNFRLRGAV